MAHQRLHGADMVVYEEQVQSKSLKGNKLVVVFSVNFQSG